jgi:hypothetical protein
MTAADIINSVGVFLILVAFLLLTLKKIQQQSVTYNLLNLIGAGLACYGSYLINAVPFIVLEGIWCLVAIYGLLGNRKSV